MVLDTPQELGVGLAPETNQLVDIAVRWLWEMPPQASGLLQLFQKEYANLPDIPAEAFFLAVALVVHYQRLDDVMYSRISDGTSTLMRIAERCHWDCDKVMMWVRGEQFPDSPLFDARRQYAVCLLEWLASRPRAPEKA